MSTPRATSVADEGLSLIELIIVVLLVGILSSVLVMILINSWNTQRSVTTTSEATNSGQLIGTSIERAVRNAELFEVSDDGRMLRVHTTLEGARTCQAFLFAKPDPAAEGDAMYMATTEASALPAWDPLLADPALWPNPWTPEKVEPQGTTPYFALDGNEVTYRFDIDTESAPVSFSGTVARRTPTEGTSSPCW